MKSTSARSMILGLGLITVLTLIHLWPPTGAVEENAAPARAAASGDMPAAQGPALELAAPPAASPALGSPAQAPPASATGEAPSAIGDPAPGTAVLDLIEALEARALSGDGLAACRLVKEIAHCRVALMWSSDVEDAMARELAGLVEPEEDLDAIADQAHRFFEAKSASRRACEGIGEEHYGKVPHLALAGALAGNLEAAAEFVAGTELGAQRLLTDPGLYAAYRRHAWPLFLRLWEQGHPNAIRILSAAQTDPDTLPLSGVMSEHWLEPAVASALHLRIQRALHPTLPERAPPQAGSAEAVADALFREQFQSSPWLHSKPLRRAETRGKRTAFEPLDLSGCVPPGE